MRSILYILFAVGGVLVAIALSMVLLDDWLRPVAIAETPSRPTAVITAATMTPAINVSINVNPADGSLRKNRFCFCR